MRRIYISVDGPEGDLLFPHAHTGNPGSKVGSVLFSRSTAGYTVPGVQASLCIAQVWVQWSIADQPY